MILPGPPYTISPTFVRGRHRLTAILLAAGLGFLALGLGLAGSEAVTIVRDARVWEIGEPALATSVEGKESSQYFIFRSYDLDVEFLDAEENEHSGRIEFDTIFGSVDTKRDPLVRYLPSDPATFSLSWGRDVVTYRWAYVAVFAVFGVGIGGAFFYLPFGFFRELSTAKACSRQATEVELTVDSAREDGQNIHYKLRGQSPWGQPLQETFVGQTELGGPLFLDESGTKVLALVSPDRPGQALVVRDTLLPFEFAPAEVEKIREKLV